MHDYVFSEEEIAEIKKEFHKLHLKKSGWEGAIDFYAQYEGHSIPIRDSYKVAIDIPDRYPVEIPALREIGGRTQAIAKKYKKEDLRTLHFNSGNGTACVCVKQEEKRKFPPGSTVFNFLNDLVIPYLYGLSFYDENGRWPWREWSHGPLGLLEFYAEDQMDKTIDMIEDLAAVFKIDLKWEKYRDHLQHPRPKKLCVCGSNKMFPDCHGLAWKGILALRGDLKRLRLDAYKLFSRSRI